MARHSNNGRGNEAKKPSGKVERVEDMLAARKARIEHRGHKADEIIAATSAAVREREGKAVRLQLNKQLDDAIAIGLVEGTEYGQNKFITEDVPNKIAKANADMQARHTQMLESIEAEGQAILSGDVIDAEYSEIDVNALFGDDDDWLSLPSGNDVPQLEGSDEESDKDLLGF